MQFLRFLVLLSCALLHVGASYAPGTVLDIDLGSVIIEKFIYLPTREGYRYGYTLPDGRRHDEMGVLLNAGTDQQDLANASAYDRNERPTRKPGVKNRKLSPGSLKSLAG